MNKHEAAFRLAAEHGRLRFGMRGRSMWPVLRPGDVAIAEALEGAPKGGDVLVFRAGDRFVAHRFIGRTGDGRLRTQGDFALAEDPPLRPEAALGRVVAIERKGRRIELDRGLARVMALALPLLRRRFPRLLHGGRHAAGHMLQMLDLGWTAAPLRRVRRTLAPAIAVAIATPSDAAAIAAYDSIHAIAVGGQNRRKDELTVIARAGDRMIGCTHVLEPPWTLTTELAGDLWIHDVHVARAWRGFGTGRAMLRAAIDELGRQGTARVRAAIRERNRRSLALHASLGFKPFSRENGYVLVELALAPQRPLG